MNPWLYVILRRRLVIRIKRYCCRWRKWMRKKTGPKSSPANVGRRNQYVHVRHQLCHLSNYVGGDIENQSLIDSLRQSLHIAQPMAMSLPDVMLVNTGRRDLDLSLSGGIKAQSYAGRVSRAYSLGHRDFYRVQSQTEAGDQCDLCQSGVHSCGQAVASQPGEENKIKVDNRSVSVNNKHDRPAEDGPGRDKQTNKETQSHVNNHSDHNFNVDPCLDHNTKENPNPKPNPISHPDSKPTPESIPKLKNKNLRDFSSVTSASFHGWSRDFRLSQHMHRPRNTSKSSSSKGSAVKVKQMSQAGSGQPKDGGQSSDSDEVFDRETGGRGQETGKDISTSGDILHPSMPTDTAFLSDTAALTSVISPPSPNLHRIPGQSPHLDTQAQVKQKPSVTLSRSLPVESKPFSVKEATTSSTRALLSEHGDAVKSPQTVDLCSLEVDSKDVKVSNGQRLSPQRTRVNNGHSKRHQSCS